MQLANMNALSQQLTSRLKFDIAFWLAQHFCRGQTALDQWLLSMLQNEAQLRMTAEAGAMAETFFYPFILPCHLM